MTVAAPESQAPVRLISRILNERLFETILRWKRMAGGDLTDATILLVVWLANTEHLLLNPEHCTTYCRSEIPQDLLSPIISNNIAFAAGLDEETTRRRLNGLVDASRLIRTDAGYLASTPRSHPENSALTEFSLSQVFTLFGDLQRYEVAVDFISSISDISETRRSDFSDRARTISTIIHLIYMQFFARIAVERFANVGPSKNVGLVGFGFMVECLREATSTPEIALAYARFDTPIPDRLKPAVSIRKLSAILEMPTETVRRYAGKLEAAGIVAKRRNGYVITRASVMNSVMYAQATYIARLGQQISAAIGKYSAPRTD